jgi:Leucine-rich repeat (LRR) protein
MDLPRFKDQVSPVAAGPRSHDADDRRGSSDPPQFKHQVDRILAEEEVPMAEATPVTASSSSFSSPPITTSRIEERLLRLETQQQQHPGGRPAPAPSTTTGSTATCSFSSKQKLWIALGSVLVVVVVVVLAVVIATVVNNPKTPVPVLDRQVPNPAPVFSSPVASTTTSPVPPTPPPPARVESIVSYISSITLSDQTLSYPPLAGTAEERAVQWLIKNDLKTTADDSDALRQRYVLSTLWFIPTPAPFVDYFGTGKDNHADTWTTDLDECAWLGVRCTGDGRVTTLSLAAANVRGRIPDDLGLLTAMTRLLLWGNQLTGTIPSSLAAMTDLDALGLYDNLLTGTIPSSFGLLTAMTSLYLGNNTLNGTIPLSLAAMTDLLVLDLTRNLLTGTIPSSLAALTDLSRLSLDINRMTGTIPSSLLAMTDLVDLGLSTNLFTGTIPSSLGVLTALTGLWLHVNQLNGNLPLCSLNRTFYLLIADCAEVSCPCCTHCCPTASEDGIIPVSIYC